jgi:hypothetical protein
MLTMICSANVQNLNLIYLVFRVEILQKLIEYIIA